jgi:hypothetical protein
MDDYSIKSLSESKNEWCARLVTILTPLINSGFRSIFNESWKLCEDNSEEDKYLMTFQNFISRIPKWNTNIIDEETKRIVDDSGCNYLEELIACVHIIQLKALTCVRVGQTQKKIDIDVPSLPQFVHKVYISIARVVYMNVYLFEKDIMPLQIQKHNREFENIIKECIMETIRDSIPVEKVLRAYINETEDFDVEREEKEEIMPVKENKENVMEEAGKEEKVMEEAGKEEKVMEEADKEEKVMEEADKEEKEEEKKTSNQNIFFTTSEMIKEKLGMGDNTENKASENLLSNEDMVTKSNISFTDTDKAMNENGQEEQITAPKNIERLEKISYENNERRKREEAEEEAEEGGGEGGEDEDETIKIGSEIKLDTLDVHNIGKNIAIKPDPILTDVEILT